MFGRRGLLRSTFVLGATACIPSSLDKVSTVNVNAVLAEARAHQPVPYSPHEHSAFMHGVASGDPLPNSVVLWTRVTPSPEAVPGSGVGPDIRVRWEVATDAEFSTVVRAGEATAVARHDHTVHVDPHGLEPATRYYFRFIIIDGPLTGSTSRTGRTLTAPAPDAEVEQLRLAVCSCANYEAGHFSAYSDIARAADNDEIDLVVHMGDYLYEYASGEYPGKHGVVRAHQPAWELTTLADYRTRYAHYRRDEELQDAHAAAPWVVTWDDHEIANNAWKDGAENHDPLFDGQWHIRRDAAMQAYLEWLPVRGTAPSRGGHIYRSLRFGTLAELHMLDLRSYRSEPSLMRSSAQASDHTIMGSEQFEWLSGRLTTATTQWNLIGTSVMMAPMNLLSLETTVSEPVAQLVGAGSAQEGQSAQAANPDQWDGYEADRVRLLDQLARNHHDGHTVFLTGDLHSEWANHVVFNGHVVAAELVCSSVSAPNVDDMLSLPENSLVSRTAENHLLAHNPHVEHVDLDAHGYSKLTVTPAGVNMEWFRVDDVAQRGSPVRRAKSVHYDGTIIV